MIRNFLPALMLFVGCASTSENLVPMSGAPKISTIEIFLSRGNLLGPVEFEQYKVFDGQLYSECGKIIRERSLAESQRINPLQGDKANEILAKAAVLAAADEESRRALRKPGLNSNLFDPGQALFTLSNDEMAIPFETSLDRVSEPSDPLERKLNDLAKTVRAAAIDTCGNQTFFGLGK